MSASEKLRALDAAMTDAPWFGQVNDLVGGYMVANADQPSHALNATEGRYEVCDLMHSEETAKGIAVLRNALPLIADVVEAAEHSLAILGPQAKHPCTCEGCDCENALAVAELNPALSALREHLEGGDE